MTTYAIQKSGFMFGQYRTEGATVDLTDRQAHPYLREGRITRVPAGAPSASAGRDRRATTGRRKKPAEAPVAAADDTPAPTGSNGAPDGDGSSQS